MTLQEAIDNAPEWARWIGVDGSNYGFYYSYEPIFKDGRYDYLVAHAGCIEDATGPQLIEVNK